jgi:hypothetical protein
MTYEYTGYLKPHLPVILARLNEGQTPRDIATALHLDAYAPAVIFYIARRYGFTTSSSALLVRFRDRNLAMLEDHRSGLTKIAIAKKYGMSRHRAKQIIDRGYYREKRKLEARRAFEAAGELKDIPLDALELPTRVINCLRYCCRTFGEALQLSDAELLDMPNFGRTSLKDWKQAVDRIMNNRRPDNEQ